MQEKIKSQDMPTLVSGKKIDAYNIKEVAQLSSYSQGSVNIHRQKNKFPNAYKMGNRWMIPRKDFAIFYGFDPEGEWPREEIVKMIDERKRLEDRMIEVAGEFIKEQ